jgi:type I restriction enzyme, R subunit
VASNFQFLESQWVDLFNDTKQVESYALPDPRTACFHARRTVEKTVQWLFQHDPEYGRPYDTKLAALLAHESFQTHVPASVISKARYIQKLGNVAVHSGKPIKQYDAVNATKELFHIMFWFARTYSSGSTVADVTFDQGLLPTPSKDDDQQTKAALKALNDELEKKNKELELERLAKGEIDAELVKLREQVAEAKKNNSKVNDTHDYSEADTRKHIIDLLLKEAGWKLDHPNDIEYPVTGMPISDKNPKGNGFVDYVLWGDDGLPLAVVEAKRTTIDPKQGRQQAKLYADCLEQMKGQRPIIFYTNGYDTYLWDDDNYPPRSVQGFYSKDELQLVIQRRTTKKNPADVPINQEIAGRHYQLRAIRNITEHYNSGHRRSLLVMATGTGKTRVAIALTDLVMRCNMAKRILFLADRTSLVRQAVKNFKKHLPSSNPINLLEDKEAGNSRVVVSTYHTMMRLIDETTSAGEKKFSVGHFDLIIIDEAHRSIYQKFGAIFDYFDGLLLGLTATPKDEVDHNTYGMFNLESGVPTDVYELEDAVTEGYLVPPIPITVPMKFNREGIKYSDLSEEEKTRWDALEWEDEQFPDDYIDPSALNQWLFNIDTVDKVLEHLMGNGIKVKGGDRIGKTVIFAKNHKHADFICERFDANYPHLKGSFTRVIDNYEKYAQSLIDEFSKKESVPHIAISVDMLDCGIDIPEIVNLVFFKVVRSKTKFIQMIGRGTRLCPDLFALGKDKQKFYIFDFCENFEFFNTPNPPKEPPAQDSIGKKLFKFRLELKSEYQEANGDDGHITELNQSLTDLLHTTVHSMNLDNFIVRRKRRYVEKFQKRSAWNELSHTDVAELAEHVAELPDQLDEEDITAKFFDSTMLRLQLSVLRSENTYESLKTKVMAIAKELSKKDTVPMVRKHLELIHDLLEDEYWNDIHVHTLEQVRVKLRDLVKFIDKESMPDFTVDFEDQIGEGVEVKLDGFSVGFNADQYRKKVEQYIKDHEDFQVVQKIKNAVPLTASDLEQLEAFLFDADVTGSKEDFEKAYGKLGNLAEFIRSLVGLDRDAAKKLFNSFLDESTFNATQIHFINFIIDYLTINGAMKPELLFEAPFTDIHHEGVAGVFGDGQGRELIELIETVNQSVLVG